MGGSSVAGARERTPSQSLDAAVRDRLPEDFSHAIDFHGHLCPGLTMGYRAAVIAMDRLRTSGSLDEELVGIVENDACGVDAFQYLTGCTIGKGNLIYKDYGKQAFTLVRRSDGRGVRVAVRGDLHRRDPDQTALRALVMAGDANDDERARFWRGHIETALRFLELPDDAFADVADVAVDLPGKARLFESVTCAVCGEAVMEPRVRMSAGEPCCIPCATRYGRGWEINA